MKKIFLFFIFTFLLIHISSSVNSKAEIIDGVIHLLNEENPGQASMTTAVYINILVDMFITGSIFIIGFFYLIVFFWKKWRFPGKNAGNQKNILILGLYCSIAIFRIIISEIVAVSTFTSLLPEIEIRLELISFHLGTFFLILTGSILYRDRIKKIILYPLLAFHLLNAAFILIKNSNLAGLFLHPLLLYTFTLGAYILYLIFSDVISREKNAVLILTIFFQAFFLSANELFFSRQNIRFNTFIHFCVFVSTIIIAVIMARKLAVAYYLAEKTSVKLKSLDKLKDEILANISHELKSPLNGIIGIAQSLGDGVCGRVSRAQKDNLSIIISSGKRMVSLINDILDYSKLKNADLSLHMKPVDLYQITSLVTALSIPFAQEKNITLINEISPDLALVNADESRLQQILHNLVDNAVKYTVNGSVSVSAARKNGKIEISVRDTGIGIPVEKKEAIFQAFEMVSGNENRENSGIGLGLSITKYLVDLHGSRIRLYSSPGQGSCFKFDLDVSVNQGKNHNSNREGLDKLGEKRQSAAHIPSNEIKKINGKSKNHECNTILLADDDPINIQVLVNYLRPHNFRFEVANDGLETLKILDKNKNIDLILLDMMMPRLSGYEACKIIREDYYTEKEDLPILMLTARSRYENITRGFDVGANDYITKPFSRDELVSRIQFHLAHAETAKELKKIKVNLENVIEERTRDLNNTLENLNNANKVLEELSIRDGLTGIYNRRFFDQHCLIEWKKAARNKSELSLLLIDIDYFKKINDSYGHLCGDECLKQLTEIINNTLNRESDIVSRYGGEEFAVILPNIDRKNAIYIAENIRRNVESYNFIFGEKLIPLTVSIGVATIIPPPGTLPDNLISFADEALYSAKDMGRNKVIIKKY